MTTNTSFESAQSPSAPADAIGWTAWLRFAVYLLIMPLVLFLSAGRLDWGMAWAYVALMILSTLASRLIMVRKNPSLLAERARSMEVKDARQWDKLLVMLLAVVGPLLTWVVAGLDKRFGWSPAVPFWLQLVAFAVVVLGLALATWAMFANTFFSGVVRIQKERGHAVVDTGPYRIVRHPGYAGAVYANLATPVLLGTLWAYLPVALVIVTLGVRIVLEERTLREDLPGYVAYTQKTRFRLLPGLW